MNRARRQRAAKIAGAVVAGTVSAALAAAAWFYTSFSRPFPTTAARIYTARTILTTAVNRFAGDGAVWGDDQRVGFDATLRAVTIAVAWSLGLEDEIGSIEVRKRADFTVLGADPFAVEPETLGDIPLPATVIEDVAHFVSGR